MTPSYGTFIQQSITQPLKIMFSKIVNEHEKWLLCTLLFLFPNIFSFYSDYCDVIPFVLHCTSIHKSRTYKILNLMYSAFQTPKFQAFYSYWISCAPISWIQKEEQ